MLLIAHRVNTLDILKKIPSNFGIEVDFRNNDKRTEIIHDPYCKGLSAKKFFSNYKHKFLIANIKSEGIETKVLKLIKEYKVKNYFFLDSTFPYIMKNLNKKFLFSLRASKYEKISNLNKFNRKIQWVWYDTFDGFNLDFKEIKKFKKKGFKICLVSPELHNKKVNKNQINSFLLKLKKKKIRIDAVCTKHFHFHKWMP